MEKIALKKPLFSVRLLMSIAEEFDWNATYDGEGLELEKYSSFGQDFICSIKGTDAGALRDSLKSYIDDFDPDEEAIKWVGPDGHGVNGAPYRLRDIIADMDECLEMMKELLKKWEEKICPKK